MARVNGEVAELWVGPTPTKVSGVGSYSYDHESNEVEDSDLGEDYEKVAAGAQKWRATVAIKADSADAGQALLALGAEVVCNFYNEGPGSGAKYMQGTGVVLKAPRTVERGARQMLNLEIGPRSKLEELVLP